MHPLALISLGCWPCITYNALRFKMAALSSKWSITWRKTCLKLKTVFGSTYLQISNTSNSEKHENSELFADWVSGRVTSPDSRTIERHVSSMVQVWSISNELIDQWGSGPINLLNREQLANKLMTSWLRDWMNQWTRYTKEMVVSSLQKRKNSYFGRWVKDKMSKG